MITFLVMVLVYIRGHGSNGDGDSGVACDDSCGSRKNNGAINCIYLSC